MAKDSARISKTTVITVQLDPFYQSFLRSFFNCRKRFMEFPIDDDLEYCISSLLKPIPEGYSNEWNNEWNFNVEIPLRTWQSNSANWMLTPEGKKIFAQRVKGMFDYEFHDEVQKLVSQKKRKWLLKEAIEFFMEKFDIPVTTTNYERLAKDFQRWRNRKYVKQHRKKKIRQDSRLSA
jgi:hypothetical protein